MYGFLYIFYFLIKLTYSKNYLPIFTKLPPTLVYYSDNQNFNLPDLECKVWPPSSDVRFYSTTRAKGKDKSSNNGILKAAAPLHPLDTEFLDKNKLIIKNIQQVRRLNDLDLHCLVSTKFGAVISRPFRIVEARIGNFPSSNNVIKGAVIKKEKIFIRGNVAYVNCDPPISFPPAEIKFTVNGSSIPHSSRYRFVKRPNSNKVTMLIQSFEPKDQGFYRCIATNMLTGEDKTDPLVQELKILNPNQKIKVTVKMKLTGQEKEKSGKYPDEIVVREGVNVTLFCVMEGAPPPHVTTYKHRSTDTSGFGDDNTDGSMSRHKFNKDFGLLTINGVTSSDEDNYLCSDTGVSDTAKLKVQKRLSITRGPHDIRVNSLGSEARFTCSSSENSITPHWYFNGRIRTQTRQVGSDNQPTNLHDSSLHIANVRQEDLGVYQCVARSKDEWVTEIATLSLKSDPVITKENENNKIPRLTEKQSRGDTRGNRIKKNGELSPPKVKYIDDNLAVLLQWESDPNVGVVRHYRVQYKSKISNSDAWSTIQTLNDQVKQNYFYITNRELRPQKLYIFRISAVLMSGAYLLSQWSEMASFLHVYNEAPVIMHASQKNATHAQIKWKYSPVNERVNKFRLLVRLTVLKNTVVQYKRFKAFKIIGESTREAIIGTLKPGRYQVVIYGIYEMPRQQRMITQYSAVASFLMQESGLLPGSVSSSGGSDSSHTTTASTRLMFIILGSLAGLMALVIIVLVLMCYCRERKAGVRLNRYKDPAKLLHNGAAGDYHANSNGKHHQQQSSFLLASINAAAAMGMNGSNNNNNTNNSCSPEKRGGPDINTVGSGNQSHHHNQLQQQQQHQSMMYCQQKRQPPSGGSGHDLSVLTGDGTGTEHYQQHGHTQSIQQQQQQQHQMMMMMGDSTMTSHLTTGTNGMVGTGSGGSGRHGDYCSTPQPPSVTYYYRRDTPTTAANAACATGSGSQHFNGPASLPAGSLQRSVGGGGGGGGSISLNIGSSPVPVCNSGGGGGVFYQHPMMSGVQMVTATGTTTVSQPPYQQYQPHSQPPLQHPTIQQHQHNHHHPDMRSQDGGESVYSYFSQNSSAGMQHRQQHHLQQQQQQQGGNHIGTAEAGSQTINSTGTGSVGHRHHRRKRRKTNHHNQSNSNIATSSMSNGNNNGNSGQMESSVLIPNNNAASTIPPPPLPMSPQSVMVSGDMISPTSPLMMSSPRQPLLSNSSSIGRDVMYDTPAGGVGGSTSLSRGMPSMMHHPQQQQQQQQQHHQPQYIGNAPGYYGTGGNQHQQQPIMMGSPPQMMLDPVTWQQAMAQAAAVAAVAAAANQNSTLTRRGTPTLFVEPPRIRDYTEYGIPPGSNGHANIIASQHQQQQQHQPQQQLAHLSQQNLHLHNQNQLMSGAYRDPAPNS